MDAIKRGDQVSVKDDNVSGTEIEDIVLWKVCKHGVVLRLMLVKGCGEMRVDSLDDREG